MSDTASQAVLDLSASRLPALARFAAGLEGLTFARLVVIAGRLDRSLTHAGKVQDAANQVTGLEPDFQASLCDLDTHLAAMFALVEAEIERRLAARA